LQKVSLKSKIFFFDTVRKDRNDDDIRSFIKRGEISQVFCAFLANDEVPRLCSIRPVYQDDNSFNIVDIDANCYILQEGPDVSPFANKACFAAAVGAEKAFSILNCYFQSEPFNSGGTEKVLKSWFSHALDEAFNHQKLAKKQLQFYFVGETFDGFLIYRDQIVAITGHISEKPRFIRFLKSHNAMLWAIAFTSYLKFKRWQSRHRHTRSQY